VAGENEGSIGNVEGSDDDLGAQFTAEKQKKIGKKSSSPKGNRSRSRKARKTIGVSKKNTPNALKNNFIK
jgi:hypothetical protein